MLLPTVTNVKPRYYNHTKFDKTRTFDLMEVLIWELAISRLCECLII